MKTFVKALLASTLLLSLAGCDGDNTQKKVHDFHFTMLGENTPISGGAAEGSISGSAFGFSGQFRSYLNSDMARVPVKVDITFSNMSNNDMLTKTYMYDVFLQNAEVIDIVNNGSLKNLKIRYTSTILGYDMVTHTVNSRVCYGIYYNDRIVDVETPGNKAYWCDSFD